MNYLFSYFNKPIRNIIPNKNIDLIQLTTIIRTDFYLKEVTNFYRNEVPNERKSEFKNEALPIVTFSGTFKERKDNALINYSGLLVLDFDNLSEAERRKLGEYVITSCFVVLAFVSISGGMKIVIRNPDVNRHKEMFNAARQFFSSETGIPIEKIDRSGINLSRACFLCHDDKAHLNPLIAEGRGDKIKVIVIPEKDTLPSIKTEQVPFNLNNLEAGYSLNYNNKNLELNFRALVRINEKKEGEYDSPRQTWLHRLACLCNVFGMDKDRTGELMRKYYQSHPKSTRADKPMNADLYITATVKDVYKRYADDFNKWEQQNEAELNDSGETPCLPCDFFKNLPPFLSKIAKVYKNKRERDLVLLATIGVLSSCFPTITGRYDNRIIASNLFFFIGAPAAAGKGCVSIVRLLGRQVQKQLDDNYEKERNEYAEAMEAYKEAKADGVETELPKEPRRRLFFIPANSSTTKMIETLIANQNFGIILDTEADTLSQSFKNEWGNYSDVIRKTFHHEPIELQRMNATGHLSMETSYLSLILTGTPNQISNLTNVENGIFSRFFFYDFPMPPEWKNVFAVGDDLPETAFTNMGINLCYFMNKLQGREVTFTLTPEQEVRFNTLFKNKKAQLMKIYGDGIMSNLHRLGTITFRLAMIFTIIRSIENCSISNDTLICTELDFDNAITMMELSLEHMISVYNRMKSKQRKEKVKPKVIYFNNLPDFFDRKTAMEIAKLIGMNEKTAEYNLTKFIEEGVLVRERHNAYKKN